jgi:hypothetical protein
MMTAGSGAGNAEGAQQTTMSNMLMTLTSDSSSASQTASSGGTVSKNGAEQLEGLSRAGGFVMLAGMGVGFALFM